MGRTRKTQRTLVGTIAAEVLAYTSGRDLELDAQLVEVDCIGTAAHVTMLARLPQAVRPFGAPQRHKIVAALLDIMRDFRAGKLRLRAADQDVHLAVERILTRQLGDLGRKIHLGRSRNDQAAVDLRLYSKEQLLQIMQAALELAEALLKLARSQAKLPMVGRTHMQPAMPSSVGLWASAYAESLLEDVLLLQSAYRLNDQCPLGSAAGYGVPLPIDRHYVAQALGFSRPLRNVFHAGNTRGKIEATILASLSQAMISISRLAQDLMLFTLPEFNYMALPAELGTGSSIMPQKNNPDVLELVRARAARVISWTGLAMQL
ncbi:MAG: argininosuccinate lyase, partial [Lentisphaerae bacterium]|nr:argininosuccinate lyase [Lentisphaerota bacterium]